MTQCFLSSSRECKEYGTEKSAEKAQELVSAAVEARETSKKEELDGSRSKILGVAKRKKLAAQVVVNMPLNG